MRKLALAGLGVVALAAPAQAFAQTQTNTYTVTASVTPKAKGAKAKPVSSAVRFGFKVDEANGLQPAAVKRYTIGFGGLKTNGKAFKTCQASQMQGSDADCPKGALVGSGTIDNYVYQSAQPNGDGGFPCAKDLHIWNAGANKAVLFVTGDANKCGGVGALAPIPAKFVKFGSNGQALQFEVPDNVLHPIAGLTVAIRSVNSTIKNQKATYKGKKVGFFETVAKSHPVEVTFLTETGQSAKASTKG